MREFLPQEDTILLVYGGGSIRRNGVYDQVVEALKGLNYVEYSGIQPNPAYEQLMPALTIIRSKNIRFILAVGGGSVIDGAKFLAAAACYKGADPWEILSAGVPVTEALPLGTVLTLPATGTEMNANAVITRQSVSQKLAFASNAVMPRFSVLDPMVTYSLPKKQLANGIIDAYVHVLEQYLTYPMQAEVQDRFAESLLIVLKDVGSRIYAEDTPDYDSRANFMWAAANALNSSLSMGVRTDWTTHTLGHELTVLYGWDHALTLAVVLPGVMQVAGEARKDKMLQYADRIWGVSSTDSLAVIREATRLTEQFFRCLGVRTRFSELGIGHEVIDLVVDRLKSRGVHFLGRGKDLTIEDVPPILRSRL